jgi:hypothetical protein
MIIPFTNRLWCRLFGHKLDWMWVRQEDDTLDVIMWCTTCGCGK